VKGRLGRTLESIRHNAHAGHDLIGHDISIFNWLLGTRPKTASTTGAAFLQPDLEDVVLIFLCHLGDVLAGTHVSWLNPKKVRQIKVVRSKPIAAWAEVVESGVTGLSVRPDQVEDLDDAVSSPLPDREQWYEMNRVASARFRERYRDAAFDRRTCSVLLEAG